MKIDRLKERLQIREQKLKVLLELTQAINQNLSIEELIDQFREIVEEDLRFSRLSLILKIGEEWKMPLSYGSDFEFTPEYIETYFRPITSIELIHTHPEEVFQGFDLFIPVLHEERPLAYLLIGDVSDDEGEVSPIIKHMRFVQTITNLIAVAIDNKALFEKSLEQERIQTELDLAAEMQALLVDSGTKKFKNFEVSTYYKPHQQVGGDFFDFIPLNENDAFFCVADVSGKGVSAAFLMSNIQAHLRALLKYTDWTLESLANELNDKVNETVGGDRFVTMFMGYYNGSEKSLTYVNCGHNPPVLNNNGQTRLLESGSVGIGMLPKLPFVNSENLDLSENARLVCYTDGVVEIEDENGDEFGYNRIAEILRREESLKDMESLVTKIMSALDKHRGKNPYFDDTALLCCRFD
jgi:sigma-B regulation protein RsbU (phosphoserine phosphatase)